jgi:DNA topoisomerase IB
VGSKEKGFSYVYPDSGQRVREEKVLERVESLKIPPAYRGVRIARGPSAKVQAVGYDSAGRLQYIYNPKYKEKKEREKFERVLRFADALSTMRQVTSGHLRRKKARPREGAGVHDPAHERGPTSGSGRSATPRTTRPTASRP